MIVNGEKRSTKSKDVIKDLAKGGYVLIRKSSHLIFIHPDTQSKAVIPHHKTLSPGLVRQIYGIMKENA